MFCVGCFGACKLKGGELSEDFYIHHSSFCIHHKKGAPSEPPKELWMDNVKRHLLSGDKLPGRESDVNFGGFAVGTDYFQPFYHDTADLIHRLFQFTELASGFVEVQGVDHRGNHDRHIADFQVGPAFGTQFGTRICGSIQQHDID